MSQITESNRHKFVNSVGIENYPGYFIQTYNPWYEYTDPNQLYIRKIFKSNGCSMIDKEFGPISRDNLEKMILNYIHENPDILRKIRR